MQQRMLPRAQGTTVATGSSQAISNQLNQFHQLNSSLRNFDQMLEEMDAFQRQTENLVNNLAAIDQMMGSINRDLTNMS